MIAKSNGTAKEPVTINFDRAVEIHRGRIKDACDKKIEALTKEMAKAFEKSNLPEAVAIGRTTQILRTMAEGMNFSHCKNVHDLKYSIPRELFDVWDFYPPQE